MPSSDRSEKSGNRPPYPVGATFAKLLDWHLDFGTRPDAGPDRPSARWGNTEFSEAVGAEPTGKTVRNWRAGRNRPDGLGSIEVALFGKNPAFNEWRFDLRAAFEGRAAEPEVPLPPGTFLGRDTDLDVVRAALLSNTPIRAILIQGSPGIGKTALTKAVAHDPAVVESFGERPRWFVRLETASTAALLQDAITRAVGANPQAGFRATLAVFRQRPGLLVLDNLETPWEPPAERRATEETLAALARAPGLALLASFRGRERVVGPAWTLLHFVERLASPYDAHLFEMVAGQSFAHDPHLERFLAALDGVPLAIELVAHHAYGSASLASLWTEWERIGAELAHHPDHAPERDTSLPHSIELSLRSGRMTKAAHRLFCLLGQLPAGIVAEDRDHLLGPEGFAADEALRRVGLAGVRDGRLDLLSPIREHARRRHRPDTPDEVAWSAHYLDLTRNFGERIGTSAGTGVMQRLVPEFANISAAIAAVLPHRLDEAVVALSGFSRLASVASMPVPILHRLAMACRDASNIQCEAICIKCLGEVALIRSDYDGAHRAYDRALVLNRQISNVLGEANCIARLGEITLVRPNYDGARKFFDEALNLYRQIGNVLGEANAIARLGEIAMARADREGARYAFNAAMSVYHQIGNVLGEANCIGRLGEIAMDCADYDEGCHAYDKALTLHRQIGNVVGEANSITRLGEIAMARVDYDGARRAFDEALTIFRQVGNVLGEAHCIMRLGDVALARTNRDGARRAYDEALTLFRQIRNVQGEVGCIASLGDLAMARADLDGARRAYNEALTYYRRIGDPYSETKCLQKLADLE